MIIMHYYYYGQIKLVLNFANHVENIIKFLRHGNFCDATGISSGASPKQ